MSHLISHLLTALVMLLIAKTVRQFAEQRMNGREGRITLFARLLPIIPLGLFSTFAVFALQDPDPDDRLAGWFVTERQDRQSFLDRFRLSRIPCAAH